MTFKNGNIPWNKGIDNRLRFKCIKCRKEFCVEPWRLSRNYQPKYCSKKCYYSHTNQARMKGKHHSEETKQKLRQIKRELVRKGWKPWLTGTKGIVKVWNKGILGERNSGWKGGITPINQRIRVSFEYRLWRKSLFERDNYTCVWCGSKERVEADHIKSFSQYPELRFAIDNGRTLCYECHKKTSNYGVKSRSI